MLPVSLHEYPSPSYPCYTSVTCESARVPVTLVSLLALALVAAGDGVEQTFRVQVAVVNHVTENHYNDTTTMQTTPVSNTLTINSY